MKLKLDENMPHRAARLLSGRGHDVATVVQQGLGGRTDAAVAQAARREGRMIVTLDRRFADIRRYPPGRHPGLVVLRLADQSTSAVERWLDAFLSQHELDQLSGCIVIIEPGAIRIRRPA